MERTLAELARDGAPLEVRMRIALALVRAVGDLHRSGSVHGALSPATIRVTGYGDAVALSTGTARSPLELAGFAAPEVVRGAGPTRRSDAFAAGALVRLALTGRGPWVGEDPLDVSRRVLFEPPRPARLDEPGIPAALEEAIARALAVKATRRGTTEDLARAIEAALGSRLPTPTSTPTPTPIATPALSLLRLAPVALGVLVAIAVSAAVARSGGDLSREVALALARGDVSAARARLDQPPRGVDRAVIEKLRGDVACARRIPGECLRRYRTALAARPTLRDDEALRRNVRGLLSPGESCATRRSAALLAGELRDRDALPALEAARRSGGFLAFLCTGDTLDRAIAATRAAR
jgi:hypothetical protein